MDFFNDVRQNMGSMLSDDQKDDLKKMGERFYGSIDMEKYKPQPVTEGTSRDFPDQDHVHRIRYQQLKRALCSGLQEEDLSEDERELIEKFSTSPLNK
jgi:hypothetical protein